MKGKTIRYSILGLLIVFALVVVIWGFSTGFKYFTAEKSGQAEAEQQIQSAEFRIFSYQHFYDQLANINSAEATYDSQYDLLQATTKDTSDYSRIQRNLAASVAFIEQLKRQYNADAAKEETMGQFRASNLPSRITVVPHKYGSRT